MRMRSYWFLLAVVLVSFGADSGASPVQTVDAETSIMQMVSANTVALASIEPGGTDFSDLAAFGRAVGERPMVILDEPTHGDGPTFRLKTRLVEYLHQKKGFDLLLIESGLYDLTRMRERHAADGTPYAALAPGRMFFMYSRTVEGRKVLDYVAGSQKTARPLELGGYDISMGGSASNNELLPGLSGFLAARNSSLPKDPGWPSYRKLAAQVVALRPAPPPTDTELAAFRRVSARLDAELCGVQGDNAYTLQSAGFWCRIVKGVHAGHERQWTPNDTRDLAAGGNVQWLMANAFKGRKVVLWMHSCHAINGLQCGANRRNVGTLLSAAYGDQVYIAHFTSGRGPYNAYGDFGSSNPAAPPTLPPLASGMLEYYLAKAAKPAFMSYPADAAGRERLRGLSIFEPEFVAISPNHFGSGYGGLFFIPQAVAIVPDAASFPELPMAP